MFKNHLFCMTGWFQGVKPQTFSWLKQILPPIFAEQRLRPAHPEAPVTAGLLHWGFSHPSQNIPSCSHWHHCYWNPKEIPLQNSLTVYFVTANSAPVSTGNKSWALHGVPNTVNIHCQVRLISHSAHRALQSTFKHHAAKKNLISLYSSSFALDL